MPATAPIGKNESEHETDPGSGPIRGTFRPLEKSEPHLLLRSPNGRPPAHRHGGTVMLRNRLLRALRQRRSAGEADIHSEYAAKIAAISLCVPKAQRAAAIQALIAERGAKLRRLREAMRQERAALLRHQLTRFRPQSCDCLNRSPL